MHKKFIQEPLHSENQLPFISILIATDIANHQHQSLKIHQRSIPLPAHRKTGTIPFSTRLEGRGSRTAGRQDKSQGEIYDE